jgi:hypothetical protein
MSIYLYYLDMIDLCVLVFAIVLTLTTLFYRKESSEKRVCEKSCTQIIPFVALYSICLLLLHFWWLSLPDDPLPFFTRAIIEMGILVVLAFVFTLKETPAVDFPKSVQWGAFFGLISISFTILILYIFTPVPSPEYVRKIATSGLAVDHSLIWNLIFLVS